MGLRHGSAKFECNEHPVVLDLAKKYEKTPIQILLAWGLGRGYCVIPKAASEGHQTENFQAASFSMTAEEVQSITTCMDKYHLLFKDWPEFGFENIFA